MPPKNKKTDYYSILGISKDASEDEIRNAFRKVARKYHPDFHPNDKKKYEKFLEISEAFDVLSDTGKRNEYDRSRDSSAKVLRDDSKKFMFAGHDLELITALRQAYLSHEDGFWAVKDKYAEKYTRGENAFIVRRKNGDVVFFEKKVNSALGWDWVTDTNNSHFGDALKSIAMKLAGALDKNEAENIDFGNELKIVNKHAEYRPLWLEGGLKNVLAKDVYLEVGRSKSGVTRLESSTKEGNYNQWEKK